MRARPFIWILLCLLCLAGAWLFWHQENGRAVLPHRQVLWPRSNAALPQRAIANSSSTNNATSAKTNQFAWRLSNTTKSLDQLMGNRHAILLENALIDTASPLNLSIPKNLQSQGDPGAYIVQARGPIDNAFRAMLSAAGAEIVSYIPNDAYLVRAPAGVANGLAGNPLTQAVIPYEPYYKISSSMPVTVGQKTLSSAPTKTNRAAGPSLLALAVKQSPLPAGTYLTLGLFKNGAAATVTQIEKLGGQIVARDNSPFGPVVRVQPPQNWTALATLSGVQIVEPCRPRMHANDLSRATIGVAADTQVSSNYMNLSGKNVLVEVNDTGIDANHPDFTANGTATGGPSGPTRVIGDSALSLVDINGHGTHVAGIIAGNGSMSSTVTNASGSVSNADFRGMAPLANLYSVAAIDNTFSFLNVSDQYLQEAPARTNALISNNSWNYGGDNAYDLSAASYDAAVRDALPQVTGSQPVLFVFSAGNSGGGDDSGDGGSSDTIQSPATAKNVITVGALEQARNITNIVTKVVDGVTNPSTPWRLMTDSGNQVAGYSSCGNVGVGTEGTFGRFKPDVVAPGTFVISTRSGQWDEQAYYNPTNYYFDEFSDLVDANSLNAYFISLAFILPNTVFSSNVVAVSIQVVPNANSPVPFPNFQIFVSKTGTPDPTDASTYDFVTMNNQVSIPPDGGGSYLTGIQEGNLYYAVVNTNSQSVIYDIITEIVATNQNGDYFQVLSNLNDSIGPPGNWYRYETGTSMSAADVSGVLALMQEFFTKAFVVTPSPALLKALLINGSRETSNYKFAVANGVNIQGWGLINLPDSLPPGVTNISGASCSSFFIDQSPTSALATGDSHTFKVQVSDPQAVALPLRVTLAWTDPPGDPAAAIKLVNNLDLVVTNLDTGAVYFGNDFAISGSPPYSNAGDTNFPNLDVVNNVENVFLSPLLGMNYTVTIIGRSVNVNAVTAQTNNALGNYAPNVVQDYALVISCGEGEVTNAFTVTDVGPGLGIVSNPTSDQQITYVGVINAPLLNQLAGASTPLLGTNTIQLTTNGTELNGIQLGGTSLITLGMTNQWHFYVITNTGAADFTNAAFITFIPETLSIPRMGVFADSTANATRPEADIDLYVSSNPGLTNLDPVVISNADKSVGRGGTEFVFYTNSAPGKVYYVGVYSEDQEASEYGFIPIITNIPFSQINSNGDQIVNGLVLPVNIPDGSTPHPGIGYVFALAIYPMEVQRVVVTNVIAHQHLGDLIGTLTHGNQAGLSEAVVLNNHDAPFNPPSTELITNLFIYDDSGQNNIFGSQPSDGPGSLNSYVGQQAMGPWILTEVDNSLTQTGAVTGFNLLIEPHQNLGKGVSGTAGPFSWGPYYYIDVPSGAASLTISATNLTPLPSLTPPLDLYVKFGSIPTLTDTNEYGPIGLTNPPPLPATAPGNSITINSPAPGRYWISLYNGSAQQQNYILYANLGLVTTPAQVIFNSSGPAPILDDAVMTDSIYVTADQTISSVDVGLRVNHPRVSDLVFHLISPDGTRVLLVENRGGATANMGGTIAVTNIVPVTSTGGAAASSSVINLATDTGTLSIFYNFYSQPDEMVINDQSGAQIFDSGLISGSGEFNVAYANSSFLTIEMNPFGNSGGSGDLWDYTVSALQAQQTYLVLTENTNLTTTPIKFAPPPFVPAIPVKTANLPEWHSSFRDGPGGEPGAGTIIGEGWLINSGSIDMLFTGMWGGMFGPAAADEGTNYIDLNGGSPGTISTNVATVPGQTYVLSFAYSRNPDGGSPDVVQLLADGNLLLTLVVTNDVSWENLAWATTSVVFTATLPSTLITFASQTPGPYGVLLDCIDLTSSDLNDSFENTVAGDYVAGTNPGFGGWAVNSNQVTVISNAVLAKSGNNLLALADGTISRVLPTVPGQTYTLSFAYRGPGAVALWRGESNAVDSIYGNNGTVVKEGFTNGEVGTAFACDPENWPGGTYNGVDIPDSPAYALTNSLSIEGWVRPRGNSYNIFWRGDNRSGWDPYFLGMQDNNTLGFYITDSTGTSASIQTTLVYNQWWHVAATLDGNTGIMKLYTNGVIASQMTTALRPLGNLISTDHPGIGIGNINDGGNNFPFIGDIDEISLYSRALSASEIKAIYQKETLGITKFATNAPAGIAQGLAEAQVTLNGAPQSIFFGNNTNWQTATYSFIATTTNTPLQITGIEPGMLLDSFVMTQIPTNNYDLYYLPEESLDLLQGENAYGQWQLEIQDDRAGAGLTNTLVKWQLRFNFPTVGNPVGPITSGLPQTNTIPAGGLAWYQINVPINADFATNILLFSTGPKNIWFDTNNPPTTNVFLFSGTNGSFTLSTTGSAPTNLIPGSTYYVVEQNTNSFAITNAFEVDFHFVAGISGPFAFTQPAYAVTGTSAQLNGMATPNGLPATAWFQWGTSTAYGNQTPPVSVGTGSNVVYVANTISGLLPNVPYHFRLVVSNALAVVYGFDQILDEANVVVWGADYVGQANVPSGLSNVVAIAGAYDHSLALKNNGTAVAWGDNTFGQANVPVGLNNLLALAGGEYYSMALKNSGTVAAWGANILGQTNVPAGLNNVVTIAGGTYSSLALRSDGTVTTWGANFFGLTNVPAGFSNAVAIAGGSYHNLAIKNDGTIVAWGDDSAGQTNVPAGLTNVVAIAGGSYHSLALRYDGTVVAWGDNSAGQTSVPAGLSHVVAVAAGGFHSLALKNDGTVVAWGDNTAGQTSVPVGLSNVVAIASGYFHSLALTPLFNVNPTNPIVLNLTNGVPQTNSILAGGIVYYQVNVPANADFATNILLFTLNGPLNVWLGTNSPTTNVFLFSGTNGSYTLSTTGTPPLVPGSTYYLGVQNTNSFTVNYGIEVDFHLLTATNAPIFISGITATNIGGTNGFLLQWQGPTNFQYEIQWTTNLLPLIVWNTVLNPVINVVLTSTNGHYSFFDDGSLTGGPALMKFYRILASPNLGPITNPGPATNTVLAGDMSQAVVTVPANAIAASNFLIAATGPLNVWFNQTNPPTGNTNAGDFLMLSATSAGAFVLTGSSVPPLVPGTNYYLGIQNPGASNVTFVFQVAFGFAPTNAVANFSIIATNGGIWLRWNGQTNYQYQVQWTTNLAPPAAWNTISNIVLTSTTGIFTFFDDGSLTGGFGPMKFYRLIAWPFMTPIPQTLSISSVTVTNIAGTNDLMLRWSAPTNYQYGIQWTTNLTLPFSNWFIIASPVLTLTNGVYTFIDNGQTGPPAGAKFFRLLEN